MLSLAPDPSRRAPQDPEARRRYVEELRRSYQQGTLTGGIAAEDVDDDLLDALLPERRTAPSRRASVH